jgi:hypothetical protein
VTQATNPKSKEILLAEINLLGAFKRVASTPDGKIIMDFILKKSKIGEDPFTNSGHTANVLGMQKVGRAVIDKLIEAGVEVDCSVFSNKSKDKLTELRNDIKRFINTDK